MSLSCPISYRLLSPEEKKKLVNGCGPAGWKGDFIPDHLMGVSITEPCNIHDYRYFIGTTEEDRKAADREFLDNMLDTIEDHPANFLTRNIRRKLALDYYCAVRDNGAKYFWAGKERPMEIAA